MQNQESINLLAKYLYTFDYCDAGSADEGPLTVNAKVHLLATDYRMPGLASLAIDKFKAAARDIPPAVDDLAAVLRAIYRTRIPTSVDDNIRSLAVDLCLHSGFELKAGLGKMSQSAIFKTMPMFVSDLVDKWTRSFQASTDGHTTAEHEGFPRRNRDPVSFQCEKCKERLRVADGIDEMMVPVKVKVASFS